MNSTVKCLYCEKDVVISEIKEKYDELCENYDSVQVELKQQFSINKKQKKEIEQLKNLGTRSMIKIQGFKKTHEELSECYDSAKISLQELSNIKAKYDELCSEYEKLVSVLKNNDIKIAKLKQDISQHKCESIIEIPDVEEYKAEIRAELKKEFDELIQTEKSKLHEQYVQYMNSEPRGLKRDKKKN